MEFSKIHVAESGVVKESIEQTIYLDLPPHNRWTGFIQCEILKVIHTLYRGIVIYISVASDNKQFSHALN